MIVWWGYGSDIVKNNTSASITIIDMEDTVVILGQLLLVSSVIGGEGWVADKGLWWCNTNIVKEVKCTTKCVCHKHPMY